VRNFKNFSAAYECIACLEWVQTRHKEKECEVVIGVGYFAAVNCGSETIQSVCLQRKEMFSRELILWQVLENL